jgi:hypothetical protein
MLKFWPTVKLYMDDGSFHIYNSSAIISTNSFTKSEVELLSEVLNQKFNLHTKSQKTGRNGGGFAKGQVLEQQYVLYFPKVDLETLRILIKPYMIPSMFYKLGLDTDDKPFLLKKQKINPLSTKPTLRPLEKNPKEVVSILIGTLLGGASATRLNNKSTTIRFSLSAEKFEYAKMLHSRLSSQNYCSSKELQIRTREYKNSKPYSFIRFSTWSFPSLNELYALFYPTETHKKFPENINDLLDKIALFYWIKESGTFFESGLRLSTICLTEEEARVLQECFKQKFHLDSTIQSNNSTKWKIFFSANETEKLIKIIANVS